MDTSSVTVYLVVFVGLLARADGAYKRWVRSTNYDAAENWGSGAAPCPNDRVHFPAAAPAPVYMHGNVSATELILPINGELVLADYMSITFPTQHSNRVDCPGQDVHFTRTSALSWLDPDNWCEAAAPGGRCLADQPARLDTERVPCRGDHVFFPSDRSFYVELPAGVDLYMGALTIGANSYTSSSLRDFLHSKEGKKQFVYSESGQAGAVTVASALPPCDVHGCVCANDRGKVKELICESMQRKCEPVPCEKPILVDGNCCHVCGAVLQLEYSPDFNFNALHKVLNTEYKRRARSEDVVFSMSRTSRDTVVVVVTDGRGGSDAAAIALGQALLVQADMSGPNKFGITDVRLETSDSDAAAAALTGRGVGGGLSGGSVAGIVLSLLLLLLLVAVAMVCLVDRSQFSRLTSRLRGVWPRSSRSDEHRLGDEDGDLGGVELTPSPPAATPHARRFFPPGGADADPRAGFDNLMYAASGDGPPSVASEKPREADDNQNTQTGAVTATFDKTAENVGFANPLYGNSGAEHLSGTCGHVISGDSSLDDAFGFSNPLFMQNGKAEITFDDTTLKFDNPMYSEDGVEEDSTI